MHIPSNNRERNGDPWTMSLQQRRCRGVDSGDSRAPYNCLAAIRLDGLRVGAVAILALPGCGSLPRLVGDEVEIVLDGTSEFAADAIQLAKVT